MVIENTFVVHPCTAEEVRVSNEAILKLREEKQHKELVQKAKMAISFAIADSISTLGLAETKTIVRELHTELRTFKEANT